VFPKLLLAQTATLIGYQSFFMDPDQALGNLTAAHCLDVASTKVKITPSIRASIEDNKLDKAT